MANEVCHARSLQEVKEALVCIRRRMLQNSSNDSINNFLFSARVYAINEYKLDSRWNTQLSPSASARHANLPMSFWDSDTLKQRRFGCKMESSRSQTSVRYLIGIAMVSRLVSMISPKPVYLGPITSSFHLSIARGHCQTDSSGSLITTKIATTIAARTISCAQCW